MGNLFTITSELQSLLLEIEANDGELTEEILELLEIKQEELEDKIKQYYSIIKLRTAHTEVLKEDAQRLLKKAKSNDNLIERLKNNVKEVVNKFGYVPAKAKSKQLIYDDLKAMLISKPKLEYSLDYEQEDIELAKDIINKIAMDDREDTNYINELSDREQLINSSAVVTLTTKLSLGTAGLLMRLVGEHLPVDFNVTINRTNLLNTVKENHNGSFVIETEDGHTKYSVKVDEENTYLTFK